MADNMADNANVWRPPVTESKDSDARKNFGDDSGCKTDKLNKKDTRATDIVLVRSQSWSRFGTSDAPNRSTRNRS